MDQPGSVVTALMRYFLFFFVFVLIHYLCYGQCCSGGVPMSGNLGMPSAEMGTFQFNINYDLNNLETLKEDRNILETANRQRRTHSTLVEYSYSFSGKWSIDGFLSYVRQERTIRTLNETNHTSTEGIGDGVVLVKYRALRFMSVGLGVKAPIGSSNQTNAGRILTADLQPGSGAWDQIVWLGLSETFKFRPSMSWYSNAIMRLTGENSKYLTNSIYEFGNEFQLIFGASDQLLIGNQIFSPLLQVRLRKANRDHFNGFETPSSGGEFAFINPGLSWLITPQISIQMNGEFPIYTRVNEVQLSPSYRLNTGIFLKFARTKTIDTI